ncbi:MAG TPA: zf-HC2 domain-containing protein [Planctomycetota bacterium]|nr:zf-HC2 domain-containing protein [Planctomycetota bacterium]
MSTVNQDCPKIRQHLALFAGRDLEEPLCRLVEAHLAACGACSAELSRTLAARERISVLGAQTARGLDAIDLWPAVRESWAREREAARTEVAALNLSRPHSTRRRWIPVSLAAAAAAIALFTALHWGIGDAQPFAPGAPQGPQAPGNTENVAQNVDLVPAAEPVSNGSLRRAGPGEERLRDSSAPLIFPRSWHERTGAGQPNSLAGDDSLR